MYCYGLYQLGYWLCHLQLYALPATVTGSTSYGYVLPPTVTGSTSYGYGCYLLRLRVLPPTVTGATSYGYGCHLLQLRVLPPTVTGATSYGYGCHPSRLQGGFSHDLMLKDLSLALRAAADAGARCACARSGQPFA